MGQDAMDSPDNRDAELVVWVCGWEGVEGAWVCGAAPGRVLPSSQNREVGLGCIPKWWVEWGDVTEAAH
jgi:hypothetical protein